MEFDSDWLTLGRHRVRLRSPRGFPTEGMRTAVDVMHLAIENNMSARARLVDAAVREEKTYELSIGTTFADDRLCVPQTRIRDRSRAWIAAGTGPHLCDGGHAGGSRSAFRRL
jgi:hypothetical protein